ncbi:MAG: GAF domain-containing protein [Chloroflexi bacterium]|uniref:histidine kinase n=1 Tax=Candidatus Chlorohelix allophototropha TaxID=3003348 RepID=A0A8T7LXJ9_9CHLR|nr:GAF domain-containing protein [Chloroflexota bacterium]WJW66054.1 GAF domain-containing protein [Chloroflexota bacterium L227-S17]
MTSIKVDNVSRLVTSLDLIKAQVEEHWREEWENGVAQTFSKAKTHNISQLPYQLEGTDYIPGEASIATLTYIENIPRPIYPLQLREENSNSSVSFSAHNIYPGYFSKLIDALRTDDLEGFLEFMSMEGAKWALVEIPVDDLSSQALSYFQEINAELLISTILEYDAESRMELTRQMNKINRQVYSSLLKGYMEGHDRLVMRSLSSHHSPAEDLNASPLSRSGGGFREQVRRSLDELEALHKVNNAVNSSLDQNSVLDLTVQAVAEVMGCDICSIYVYERESQSGQEKMVLRAAHGLNQRSIGTMEVLLGEGITGIAAKEGRPISVYDMWADSRFQYSPQLEEDSSRSMLSVPIILYTREKLVGVIGVQSRIYRSWTTEEVRFLEMVAGEIALAIENSRLYQQTDERLREKVQELSTLQRVSKLIAATLDINSVLELMVQQAAELVKAEMASIYELKEGSNYLTIVASHGLSGDYVKNMQVKLGEGPVGRAAEYNHSEHVWDAHFELHPGEEYLINDQYRAAMCVPLVGAEQVILGVICVYTRQQRHFNEEQIQIISSFADQASIAIQNARLYEEAQRGLTIKSALLQEMHHRVRNNLQTVAALLSMQMRRVHDPQVVQPLSESVARIQSIAAVHDLLCREDIGVTTVNAVAKEITDIASVSLVQPDKRIRFKVDESKVPIASKEATLLAILVMELISNAIFHGFRDKNEGEVRISSFISEGRTHVIIRDNGRGYPTEFDPSGTKSGLGLQIVHTLVTKDLQGTFQMENINGWATATITFNSVYGLINDNEIDTGLIA